MNSLNSLCFIGVRFPSQKTLSILIYVYKMENMRMPELKALARESGLRGYSKLRKAELIAFLQNNKRRQPQRPQQPQQPAPSGGPLNNLNNNNNNPKQKDNVNVRGLKILRLQLHGVIYHPNSFVMILRYCVNLKAIRYESTNLNRIVADKSHCVIVA